MPAELEAARRALAEGEWQSARAAFAAALEQEETAEALLGCSEALWWLGETDEAVRCAERAYAAFRRGQDLLQATLAAVALYFHYRVSLGNAAAARGWLGRAARLVEEFALAPLEGWILLIRAHDSSSAAEAEGCARQAHELARRFGDPDLELCALSQLGAALVQDGQLDEGGALLDEAMAASLGGEARHLRTVVFTSCNTISACSQTAELERAAQWIRAADAFTRRYGSPHLYTTCRTYYGSVLFATGDWPEAERQLRLALRSGRTAERALHGEALARLAQLRLAQGRVEEAERLLAGFEDDAVTACAVAAARLARGEPAAAEALLHRRLRELDAPGISSYRAGMSICLESAAALELLAVAELERGVPADATAARLAQLGERVRCQTIVAQGERALGRCCVATGEMAAAVGHLDAAVTTFARRGMPYELARTRLLLARVLPEREAALREGRAALDQFEQLGAGSDADAAAALLRSFGAHAARRSARSVDDLTKREREVLALLAEGLSNQELAERLFVTRKTVEHHVHSVLAKLGLRSRAEAAAYAVRHSASI